MDEQIGLRGRLSLISSLVIEISSNSTFPFGGGGSSGDHPVSLNCQESPLGKVIGIQEGVLVGIRLG